MGQLIQELKRRNVIRVAIAYAVSAWLLIQVSDALFPMLRLPEWTATFVAVLLLIGFPIALIFAWAFELTPEGIKFEKHVVRDDSITHVTGRKLDFVIIAMLVVALGYFSYDKFVLDPDRDAVEIEAAVQSAGERAASPVEPQDSAKTIAVLPFADLSPDGDQEYFSDGMSEEILNLLTKVPDLRVTSRSSAFSFKGQNLDVPTMAAKLNVAHVLEGSVRRSGNQLRITAQLIDVESDTHLWSQTYDRELENIFAIQDEIATAVVDALKITLLGNAPTATETSPEAYALYLQARHFRRQYTEESTERAVTLLKQALQIDPVLVPAVCELGDVYFSQASLHYRPYAEGIEMARHQIRQALTIDPMYGPAYTILATIEMWHEWDFTTAFQHLQRAMALNPSDTLTLTSAAILNVILGRVDEAIELQRQAIALDPIDPEGYFRLGEAYESARRPEKAIEAFKMALSLQPNMISAQYHMARVLLAKGDATAALAAIEREPAEIYRLTGMAIVQYALGNAEASDAALQELIERYPTYAGYQVAEVCAFRGEIDCAFDWLEQAYDNRDEGLARMLLDSLLVNLHDDPRWEPFLDKMGLPH